MTSSILSEWQPIHVPLYGIRAASRPHAARLQGTEGRPRRRVNMATLNCHRFQIAHPETSQCQRECLSASSVRCGLLIDLAFLNTTP